MKGCQSQVKRLKMFKAREIVENMSEQELVDLVRDLIRIPSHAEAKGQENKIAHFLADKLEKEDVDVRLQEVEDDRFNVIGTIKGAGKGRSLILNGHLDTVPPSPQIIDPYHPRVRDGKLYGKGVADMKGAIGAMAYSLIVMKRSDITLDGDLTFTGVIGEESPGHGGTGYLVEYGPKADMAIVGEPTDLKIVVAHKGVDRIKISIKGKAAHSSTPQRGVNAISKTAKFIRVVEEDLIPELNKRKHNLLGSPTINIGLIKGGMNPNTVPDNCVVQIDRRWIPGESPSTIMREFEDILNHLKGSDPEFKAELERMEYLKEIPHGPLETPEDHHIVRALKKSLRKMGLSPEISGISGWTDAALLSSQAKIPTVVFGPGNLAQAHSDVEFISIDSLLTATKIYILTALEVCTRNSATEGK